MEGLKIDTGEFDFEPCCNEHDLCYGTCNTDGARDFSKCEVAFKECLGKRCMLKKYRKNREACKV